MADECKRDLTCDGSVKPFLIVFYLNRLRVCVCVSVCSYEVVSIMKERYPLHPEAEPGSLFPPHLCRFHFTFSFHWADCFCLTMWPSRTSHARVCSSPLNSDLQLKLFSFCVSLLWLDLFMQPDFWKYLGGKTSQIWRATHRKTAGCTRLNKSD